MKYKNIKKCIFLDRPNRFIANILIDNKIEICHVKNTGRCKEILIPNTICYVEECNNPSRKTKYDLIAVLKGERLINIDSQVVNKVFHEWLEKGNLFKNIVFIKPECKYHNSRFDFYLETKNEKIFLEIKGVTLENDNIVAFPDAPTERGLKHVNELIDCVKDGYKAYVVFVVQMKDVLYFTPNNITHEAFGNALKLAEREGVNILALDCDVDSDSIEIRDYVEVRL